MGRTAKIVIAVIVVLLAAGGGWLLIRSGNGKAAAAVVTAQVTRGNIAATVLSSGQLQAEADLNLSFGSGGTITQILVQKGQAVKKGEKLATLDTRDLQLSVDQAMANLHSAQAKLDSTKSGSTAKDLADAQSQIDAARAKLNQTKAGSTPQDIQTAQAQLISAQSKLHALQVGPTANDLANAQAQITSARAKLDAVKVGATTQDIANARAQVTSAQAKLDQLKAGSSPQDIASARSQIASAQAKFDQLKSAPTAADLSAAQLKVTTAQTGLDRTLSSQSAARQQAELAFNQADHALRNAQDTYNTVAGPLLSPKGDGSLNDGLSQAQIDKYNTTLRALQDAEDTYNKDRIALDDARLQEVEQDNAARATLSDAQKQLADLQAGTKPADLMAAQSTLDQAKNSLQKLLNAPDPHDVAAAQSTLDQANNSLQKLLAGPLPTDVAQAQSALDQANISMAKLKTSATHDDLVQAQAAVDQAQANLNKVKAGSTTSDIAAAQSTLDQAVNNLNDLKAGPKSTDVTTAQAGVDQARAALESAQLKLDQAIISAPFDGVVADIPVVVGQAPTASTAVIDLLDSSAYHVDMNIGETDISRVKVGQDVTLTFDALPNEVFTGTVSFVAPKATISQGVVSYLATATMDPKASNNSDVKPGMTTTAAATVQSKNDVLLVPNRAIHTQGRQKNVYVMNAGIQTTVPVQTGISNDQFTEITSNGLQEGDTVVINAPTTTAPASGGGLFGGGVRVPAGGGGR